MKIQQDVTENQQYFMWNAPDFMKFTNEIWPDFTEIHRTVTVFSHKPQEFYMKSSRLHKKLVDFMILLKPIGFHI